MVQPLVKVQPLHSNGSSPSKCQCSAPTHCGSAFISQGSSPNKNSFHVKYENHACTGTTTKEYLVKYAKFMHLQAITNKKFMSDSQKKLVDFIFINVYHCTHFNAILKFYCVINVHLVQIFMLSVCSVYNSLCEDKNIFKRKTLSGTV